MNKQPFLNQKNYPHNLEYLSNILTDDNKH